MVEVMHELLLETTKVTFVFATFIIINANEVTTLNNTQWLSIHLYAVQGWKRIPILLYVEIVADYATHYKEFANKQFNL
jgi:hypothetical protein